MTAWLYEALCQVFENIMFLNKRMWLCLLVWLIPIPPNQNQKMENAQNVERNTVDSKSKAWNSLENMSHVGRNIAHAINTLYFSNFSDHQDFLHSPTNIEILMTFSHQFVTSFYFSELTSGFPTFRQKTELFKKC